MTSNRFTYRTTNTNPSDYERTLADALFDIMGGHVHDPDGISAALNARGLQPASAAEWTADLLKAEVERLGAYTNAVGAPVGSHDLPGMSERINDD